jgi:DNA-binding response OmpR family regulator
MDSKPKALIVDDERIYCEAMRLVLEAAGVQVYVANSATEAETLFRLLVPDLVILDVLMPGMSGLELIGKLRGLVGWEHVPIVVASALGLRANREAALDAGANAYLSKPFSSRELRMTVRRFLPLAKTGELTPAA